MSERFELQTERLLLKSIFSFAPDKKYDSFEILLRAAPYESIGKISVIENGSVCYDINPEHQNKGYCTEALAAVVDFAKKLGITPKLTIISFWNFPSKRVAKKAGFVKQGSFFSDQYVFKGENGKE